ncbi:MAG: FAD:protein FMN transferase [Pirellulales bacterium]
MDKLLKPCWSRTALAAVWSLLACGQQGIAADRAPLERFEFTQVQMGMDFKLTFYAADETAANRAAQAAYARVAELNAVLSDYDPASELSRLSKSAGTDHSLPVGADLWHVLTVSQRLADASDGAFDVTVGPFVRLWRRARREREMPSAERLAEARSAVGHRLLKLDDESRTATLTQSGMRLDLGGIAAGYAADEALVILARHGIQSALVDASGDLVASDPPPGEPGWKIGIAPLAEAAVPSRFVWLANRAISTSGDAFQYVEIDGVRYSHIVDPRTGLGLTRSRAVVVVAPDCVRADSLATTLCVLGERSGIQFVESQPNVAAMFVDGQTDPPTVKLSASFAKLAPQATD